MNGEGNPAVTMDLEYELSSLQESFMKVKDKFLLEWTGHDLNTICQQQQTTFKENIKKYEGKLSSLEENFDILKNEDSKKRKAKEDLNTELKQLATEMDNIKKETDNLLQQNEHMKAEAQKKIEENERQRETIENEEKDAKFKIQELEKAVSYFTERQGLEFKKVSGGRLQLIFTYIDYKDPIQPFYCFVKIKEDRSYEVTDCEPPITDLEELAQKLNETNNFKAFIVTLRKRFKALV